MGGGGERVAKRLFTTEITEFTEKVKKETLCSTCPTPAGVGSVYSVVSDLEATKLATSGSGVKKRASNSRLQEFDHALADFLWSQRIGLDEQVCMFSRVSQAALLFVVIRFGPVQLSALRAHFKG